MRGVEGGGGGCSISRGEGLGAQIHDEGVEARMQNRGGSLRTALYIHEPDGRVKRWRSGTAADGRGKGARKVVVVRSVPVRRGR
jgi:hypothetical protein